MIVFYIKCLFNIFLKSLFPDLSLGYRESFSQVGGRDSSHPAPARERGLAELGLDLCERSHDIKLLPLESLVGWLGLLL